MHHMLCFTQRLYNVRSYQILAVKYKQAKSYTYSYRIDLGFVSCHIIRIPYYIATYSYIAYVYSGTHHLSSNLDKQKAN